MLPEYWPVVTTGIVILIAIAASNRALRREMTERTAELRCDLGGRIDALSERMAAAACGSDGQCGHRASTWRP